MQEIQNVGANITTIRLIDPTDYQLRNLVRDWEEREKREGNFYRVDVTQIKTIIFIKHRLKTGFEISGYIDYEQSLHQANLQEENCTDWAAVFGERLKLRPKPTDLSFFDWHKGLVLYNESDNYLVQHDVHYGLIFMHKGDHKKVCVDIDKPEYSKNCTRSMHFSERYGHVVFYDHVIRKKI